MKSSFSSVVLASILITQAAGCAAVDGTIMPRHFQFYDVVEKTEPGADGWRAACVHAYIKNGKLKTYFECRISVEVPVETTKGPISISFAQKTSARLANEAAYEILMVATDALPLGIACETFRNSFQAKMDRAIRGSRVTKNCRPEAIPVVFGEP